jgi:carbon monoxide dehydrogenase subunit G
MKLEGEYIFNGPQDEVWRIIQDPDALAAALPGTKSLEQTSENEYEGEMNVRIGPVAGIFSGKIIVSNENPPESCTLTVDGKGKPGFVKGVGNVNLIAQDAKTTLMKYDGDVQIGGRLASVGQRLLDTASKSMINQGLETLNNALQARVAAQEGGEESNYTPPSEGEFMAAVAKDMAGNLLSSSRALWIGVAILIILIITVVVWLSVGAGG